MCEKSDEFIAEAVRLDAVDKLLVFFFFSSRRRHTRCSRDWSSDVCSSDLYCRRWGVPLIDGGTVRLPRIVGQGRALEIILTGRKVPADECLAIGLCEYEIGRASCRERV